ncbi:glucose-1-phosphate cytidylyltransferase [Sinanaerobacter chloroacetimidivorans]|jgi:glucose-1-phosphate cytidylyltransferase|uniref:Glucose-1-phosphate cytidylyltransferase n=1 Tax=Sinanaerobacter chloroacetimidivorans TaxID=2818044 RepID=A0A8J7W0S4_9FIRM|nr:glucose-1-phosphate cytidylyltransferase [Sinanaerobacter chloroacetimidivorans]MBR0598682.1 glucose-1-phosphate cytidylyltransferase [Sinanaerobacter chloroacetimidivorans]
MKTVILCGGKGTRMREETEFRPKPLVRIGEKPIIWHIMKIYSHFGFNDFVLCVGYKGDMIKRYFMEMYCLNNDFTISTGRHSDICFHTQNDENWNVTIVDTGLESQTGKRIKQIKKYIDTDEFMLTYGDGLSDVDIKELIASHRKSGKIATLTGVNPNSPFGVFQIEDGIVTSFKEKPILDDVINGGYMVLNKEVFDYIPDQDCAFEQEPLHHLAKDSELSIYKHNGFWTAIDTYKDIERVNELWNGGEAPWKLWD